MEVFILTVQAVTYDITDCKSKFVLKCAVNLTVYCSSNK